MNSMLSPQLTRVMVFQLFAFALIAGASGELSIRPPEQPATGPGGAEYAHADVTKSVHGTGAEEYWLYLPASPTPQKAPVIVFLHGWGGMNPRPYGAWIEHLVRRGNIVIYPRYQEDLRTPTREFAPNAIKAVKDALALLQAESPVKPDQEKVGIVGHSAGAQTAANMAALAKKEGLPIPKAVMPVEPGKTWGVPPRIAIPLEDMSQVPGATLLLCVVGDQDNIVKDIDAKRIFNGTTQIPLQNKDFVTLVTDDHGSPPLTGNHFAPCAPNPRYDSGERAKTSEEQGAGERKGRLGSRIRERLSGKRDEPPNEESPFPSLDHPSALVNALDFDGVWKLFDALTDAAFYGKNRNYALGNTPEQRFMGKWSDGTPVKELKITDQP